MPIVAMIACCVWCKKEERSACALRFSVCPMLNVNLARRLGQNGCFRPKMLLVG